MRGCLDSCWGGFKQYCAWPCASWNLENSVNIAGIDHIEIYKNNILNNKFHINEAIKLLVYHEEITSVNQLVTHMASTLILRKTHAKTTKRGVHFTNREKQRADSKRISGNDNGRYTYENDQYWFLIRLSNKILGYFCCSAKIFMLDRLEMFSIVWF